MIGTYRADPATARYSAVGDGCLTPQPVNPAYRCQAAPVLCFPHALEGPGNHRRCRTACAAPAPAPPGRGRAGAMTRGAKGEPRPTAAEEALALVALTLMSPAQVAALQRIVDAPKGTPHRRSRRGSPSLRTFALLGALFDAAPTQAPLRGPGARSRRFGRLSPATGWPTIPWRASRPALIIDGRMSEALCGPGRERRRLPVDDPGA